MAWAFSWPVALSVSQATLGCHKESQRRASRRSQGDKANEATPFCGGTCSTEVWGERYIVYFHCPYLLINQFILNYVLIEETLGKNRYEEEIKITHELTLQKQILLFWNLFLFVL